MLFYIYQLQNSGDIQKFNLPKEGSLRTLIKITKVNETPSIYPRNYDKIIKKPLK